MGQDRDGDAVGSGVSHLPQHSGLGVQEGHVRPPQLLPSTFAVRPTENTGQKKCKRALLLPKRKSEVKIGKKKMKCHYSSVKPSPELLARPCCHRARALNQQRAHCPT